MTYGAYIRHHRKRLGLTQAQLANLLDVDTQSVSNWECGRNTPWGATRDLIAERFGVKWQAESARRTVIERILSDD